MKITSEQEEIIDSLLCERLSNNKNNIRLVGDFYNSKNDSIANSLRNEAFGEDESNSIAYYVIKNTDGQIIFYFSLKCGLLYDEFIELEQLKIFKKLTELIIDKQKDTEVSEGDKRELEALLEMIRSKKGIKKELVTDILHKNKSNIDIDTLFQSGQHNVGKTYSGVELMHFCANDQFHDDWKLKDIKPLGAVIFWQFIVPKIIKIMELVGCEYLFLFAADLTDDLYLVNYYREHLGFTDKLEHKVAMPLYDLTCKFMYQRTADLLSKRKSFFENFNPDENAV